MQSVIELLIVVLMLLIVGGGAYLLLEARKASGGGVLAPPISLEKIKTELDARYQADIEHLRGEARGAVSEIENELGRLREGLRSSAHEHDTQLARLRERYAEADGQTASALERSLGELRSNQEMELARLREAVGAAMAALAVRHSPESNALVARRTDAVAGLYKRLSKLETCFVSVTNPVLLPGETFSLPAELMTDTLKWENWKEVGDATFAFAEAFNQDRIFLDDATCRELSSFVSELRTVMTTRIYPNLMPAPGTDSTEARAALREALEQLGHDIPDARERLERSFREQA